MECLQTDLDKIYQWQETNNMQFNGAKFENIRYGQDEDLKTHVITSHQMQMV